MSERDSIWQRGVDRKGFVAVSALAALAAASGGRLGGDALAALERDLGGTLFYYNWADYVNPKTYTAFTKATGFKVKKDFYVSNEEMGAKLQAGARGYDLIVPTDYEVEILAAQKLLAPIDWSKLPNVKANINHRFLNRPADPKNTWSVAKDYGTTGFVYRTDLVKERPTTWREFVNLTMGPYSGKVTLLDGIQEVIGSLAIMLGYSYNTEDAKQLDEVKKLMIKLKPHILALDSSQYKQRLVAGKSVMAMGWNGDGAYVASKKPAKYIVPKEGAEFWVDAYCIPVGYKNRDAAHAWINFVYVPKNNAVETEYTYYGSPVKRALLKGVLDPKIYNDPVVFPPQQVFRKLQVKNASQKGLKLRNRIWTEFKAA